MKVWKNQKTNGFRCSPPPDAEMADWTEVDSEKLEPVERVMLRLDQQNESFVSRLVAQEKEIDRLKAQVLAHGTSTAVADKPKPISLCRLFHAIGTGDWKGADYERSVVSSDEAQELRIRAMGADTDTAGGFLVPPQYLAGEFIPLLRAKSVIDKAGARFLLNLRGAPIILPKQTGGATAYWIGTEGTSITESELTAGQITLQPHELAALVVTSNKLLVNADPSVEGMIQEDLAKALALKLDLGCLKGTGTDGQPLGILYSSGITASAATGAIPNTVFDMKAKCEAADVDMTTPGAALIVHPTGWNALRKVAAAAGTPKVYAGVGHSVVDEACDMKAFKTSQIASTDAFVGQFSELVVANWAGILFEASRQAGSAFAKNQTYMRAVMMVDVGLRQPAAFCKNTVFGT